MFQNSGGYTEARAADVLRPCNSEDTFLSLDALENPNPEKKTQK